MIEVIGVAVPARDEELSLGACLASIARAARAVPVPVVVVVAADSCGDDTARMAARTGAQLGLDLQVVACRCGSAGSARRVAADELTGRLRRSGVSSSATWISCTDADTTVPADWFVRQLLWAARGVDAVAGLVDLPVRAPAPLKAAFQAAISNQVYRGDHHHVHAANLGLRLSALEAAGGFAEIALGEDHALWSKLVATSARTIGAMDTTVVTSSRLQSHTVGGFATFLAKLSERLAGTNGS